MPKSIRYTCIRHLKLGDKFCSGHLSESEYKNAEKLTLIGINDSPRTDMYARLPAKYMVKFEYEDKIYNFHNEAITTDSPT